MASTSSEKNLAFTLVADEGDLGYQTQDLRAALEKGTDELKLDTLRRIIVSTLNGQPQVRYVSACAFAHIGGRARVGLGLTCDASSRQPALLMPIIQFVLPSKSKQIKKLLQ